MEKTYIIIWRARSNGRTGQSKKVLDIQEANVLAAELNREYPEYEHLVLNTADPQAKPTPPAVHLLTPRPQPVEQNGALEESKVNIAQATPEAAEVSDSSSSPMKEAA